MQEQKHFVSEVKCETQNRHNGCFWSEQKTTLSILGGVVGSVRLLLPLKARPRPSYRNKLEPERFERGEGGVGGVKVKG